MTHIDEEWQRHVLLQYCAGCLDCCYSCC